MSNLVISFIIASLLVPAGFNFFSTKSVDHSFLNIQSTDFPKRLINNSFGLKTTSDNILIIDDASGKVLYDKNSSDVVPIASISKLMTALVFLDTNPDWNQVVTIERDDQRQGGQVYLLTGEQVSVETLFNLMLASSANEAAIALSRISGIEDFSSAMNKKAKELGMEDSFFLEPSGLSSKNVSSAKDLIKLANEAFGHEEIKRATHIKKYTFDVLNSSRQGNGLNTDVLLTSFLNGIDYEIIGAKTGFLNEAGYCLLIKVKKVNGPTLTIALLGADEITDRWQEAKGLVDWVFENYIWS